MKKNQPNNRRQFLKNTSLAALSLGMLSQTAKAKRSPQTEGEVSLDCEKTTEDLYGQGPFYTENPPVLTDNKLASTEEEGTPIIISGRVFNLDCSEYIPDTIVDIWHANDAGQYDNVGYNLRGQVTSNEQGFYIFETIKPGKYGTGGSYRPSHIHFKITPPGFDTLTTQLYFEGDTDIPADPAASNVGDNDATNRIIPLTENSEGKFEGTWDIIIAGDGITNGLHNVHLDKGMVYKVTPNPFADSVLIQYGVFQKAQVSLLVYDAQGRLVANLEESTLPPQKYEATWQPSHALPNGHYFVALKINDLQVHYLKVIRKR